MWSLFLTNLQAWRPATLLKETRAPVFSAFFYIAPPVVASVRSSHPEIFCKKGVLKKLAKFTEKQVCWSLFLNKVAGLFSPNTPGDCFCSILLPWRLHHKRIWVAKDHRERNFLWRNRWNCESHNFRINNTVKTKIDIFFYCLRLDMKETRIFFFLYKNYSEWMNFLYV